MSFSGVFSAKRVLVTGHTGFKGAWLSEWLLSLGADVAGLSMAPPTTPALFDQLGLAGRMHHTVGDIRDYETVRSVVGRFQPDFIFHLAAQPLVRRSYEAPIDTYAVNVMGTAHVLEAARQCARPCTIVAVTTDKCYKNREWVHGYREEDAMGGHDPYSSSKGAAELLIASYRDSYFAGDDSCVRLASARAGNVIGGGDWALDRIVPDCVRFLSRSEAIPVRNKVATRPWQHVLEPLSGYLWLAACLHSPSECHISHPKRCYASAFNFGPAITSNRTVAELVHEVLKHWPGKWADRTEPGAVHEAKLLGLATDKAFHLLGWHPVWDFSETVARTISWYKRANDDSSFDARGYTIFQIQKYAEAARRRGLSWSN